MGTFKKCWKFSKLGSQPPLKSVDPELYLQKYPFLGNFLGENGLWRPNRPDRFAALIRFVVLSGAWPPGSIRQSNKKTCKGSLAANLGVVFAADSRDGDRTGMAWLYFTVRLGLTARLPAIALRVATHSCRTSEIHPTIVTGKRNSVGEIWL